MREKKTCTCIAFHFSHLFWCMPVQILWSVIFMKRYYKSHTNLYKRLWLGMKDTDGCHNPHAAVWPSVLPTVTQSSRCTTPEPVSERLAVALCALLGKWVLLSWDNPAITDLLSSSSATINHQGSPVRQLRKKSTSPSCGIPGLAQRQLANIY